MNGATGLVWDASALLNLLATQREQEILNALGCPSYVTKQVREAEMLYLRSLPEEDIGGNLVSVDVRVETLLQKGLLQEVTFTEGESKIFVQLAQQIDDGEASCCAVAVSRNWSVVLDDRKGIRVAHAQRPPLITVETPEWIKYWLEEGNVEEETLTDAINRIHICAKYKPRGKPPKHSLYDWWMSHLP
ncbi:MAG: hypothetical protein H7308_01385 [Chthonomonadaceae bacterium]|nr:hypothetical protein [Chthonomonadaceae bacterium]